MAVDGTEIKTPVSTRTKSPKTEKPTKPTKTTKAKKKSRTPKRIKAPLTTKGYEKRKIRKDPKTGRTSFIHAVGPAKGHLPKDPWVHEFTPMDLAQSVRQGEEYLDDPASISTWHPYMQINVSRTEKKGEVRALSASAIKAKLTDKNRTKQWIPHYFLNPYQHLDYLLFEMVLKNTFVGALNDALTKFIVGTGFRPELELINPDKEHPEKNEEEIKKHQDIITKLIKIDQQLDAPGKGTDISFIEKISILINHMCGYNRGALIFGHDEGRVIEVDGKKYPEIPTSIKVAHPKELGMIKVNPGSWKLEAVDWELALNSMVQHDQMIYLWNPITSAKYRNSYLYGGSLLMPMMDASRVLRQIIGADFPAIARATWANPAVLTIRPQGQEEGLKTSEYESVARGIVAGGVNILLEKPEDVDYTPIDYAPKIAELKDLCEFLIRYCVSCIGLPHSMFFDESASNRSTMLGKIQLAISTVINPLRESIGRQISSQWYQKWFEMIYADDKKILEKFRIRMVFDDLAVEEWYDKSAALIELDQRKPLKDKDFGEMLGMVNYENKIDTKEVEKREQMSMGGMGGMDSADGMDGMDSVNGSPKGKMPEQIGKQTGPGMEKGIGQDKPKPEKPPSHKKPTKPLGDRGE